MVFWRHFIIFKALAFSFVDAKRCTVQSNFDVDGVTGFIKGRYARFMGIPRVQFHVNINLGSFQPEGDLPMIENGTALTWHLHEYWRNTADSASLDGCGPSSTGGHYDPTVACTSASQWASDGECLGPAGEVALSADYFCTAAKNYTDCERGDQSGKLGPMVVIENGSGELRIKLKAKDFYFATRADAKSSASNGWSFVIHHTTGARILCAKVHVDC